MTLEAFAASSSRAALTKSKISPDMASGGEKQTISIKAVFAFKIKWGRERCSSSKSASSRRGVAACGNISKAASAASKCARRGMREHRGRQPGGDAPSRARPKPQSLRRRARPLAASIPKRPDAASSAGETRPKRQRPLNFDSRLHVSQRACYPSSRRSINGENSIAPRSGIVNIVRRPPTINLRALRLPPEKAGH